MTAHLTHDQLYDLLLDHSPHPLSTDFPALQQHLSDCSACARELSSLNASLQLFRETSTRHAKHLQQVASIDTAFHLRNACLQPSAKAYLQSVYWAVAAAILLAAVLPAAHRQHAAQPVSATAPLPADTQQSDEALLDAISQEIAQPIPSPMRPLADPTAATLKAQSNSAKRNN